MSEIISRLILGLTDMRRTIIIRDVFFLFSLRFEGKHYSLFFDVVFKD